jgi:hypothetical protein
LGSRFSQASDSAPIFWKIFCSSNWATVLP